MCRSKRIFCSVTVLFLLAIFAPAREAGAQNGSEASLTAARALGEEGLKLYDEGKYAEALERFNKADIVLNAPTIDLFAARCLEKLSRTADALRRYAEVVQASLTPSSPEAFKQAQIDAAKELATLAPRVPTLSILLEGDTTDLIVRIDGNSVDINYLNQKNHMNPGRHRIEAERNNVRIGQDIDLAESEAKTAILKLPPRPKEAPRLKHFMDPNLQRTLGFVTLGVGAGGLVLWGVTGGVALSMEDDLKKIGCEENGRCPPGSSPGSYATLRTTSLISFYAGLGVGAVGGVLLLTLPKRDSGGQSNQNALQFWISPQQAGFSGRW